MRLLCAIVPAGMLIAASSPAEAQSSIGRCQEFSERGLHAPAIRSCGSLIEAAGTREAVRALALFFRANSYHSTGEREAALDDVTAAIASGTADARAFALRGAIRLASGEPGPAIDDLSRAIDLGFDDVQVFRQRADAWLALGDAAGAAADLEEVVAANDDDAVALTQLALARRTAGDTDAAIEAAGRAIEANPAYAPAYGVRASITAARGDVEAALADYTRARDAAPGDPGYRLGRASILFAAGLADVALAEVDAVLAADPGLAEALALRADINEASGDFTAALADLDALGDDSARAALRRARLAMRAGDFARAERDYSTAIAAGLDDPAALFERGQANARLDRPVDAAVDFSLALTRDPGLSGSGVLLMRGKARFAAGGLEGAAADFAAEAERSPADPSARIWQVRALSDLGDLEAAERAARDLLRLEPDTARANAILGDVLLRKGDLAGGRAAHERALSIDPGYEISRRRLADLDTAASPD